MINAFDIKSTKIDVLSICLHTSDLLDLENVLVKLGKKFQESGVVPFMLDVQEFDYPESLDLAALVSLFSKHGMQILGLKHPDERWAAVAAKYHLLFCSSHLENIREQDQIEMQETADELKTRKTVLVTTSVRTGQQVYAEDGDLIRVKTRRAEALFPANVVETIRKDTIFIPYHWGGVNSVNQLTVGLDGLDPISKMPEFKVCACKIEKTGRKKAEDSAELAYRSRDIQY